MIVYCGSDALDDAIGVAIVPDRPGDVGRSWMLRLSGQREYSESSEVGRFATEFVDATRDALLVGFRMPIFSERVRSILRRAGRTTPEWSSEIDIEVLARGWAMARTGLGLEDVGADVWQHLGFEGRPVAEEAAAQARAAKACYAAMAERVAG